MFFFIFYSFWTSVTIDTSIRGDPIKKFWKENNSKFHVITQNINFAPCDRFSQITSQNGSKYTWHFWKVTFLTSGAIYWTYLKILEIKWTYSTGTGNRTQAQWSTAQRKYRYTTCLPSCCSLCCYGYLL